MSESFLVGIQPGRHIAGHDRVIKGALVVLGLAEMIGETVGLLLKPVAEQLFDRVTDRLVVISPPADQDRTVGRLTH